MKKIGLLNGPNLDRLGKREPEIYGSKTLEQIVEETGTLGKQLACEILAYQSNHEGALIDKIHEWSDAGFSGLIVNPGGFTHTSVALRDAVIASGLTTIGYTCPTFMLVRTSGTSLSSLESFRE